MWLFVEDCDVVDRNSTVTLLDRLLRKRGTIMIPGLSVAEIKKMMIVGIAAVLSVI